MPAVIKEEECIGCAACLGSCPVTVIEMNNDGKAHVVDGCIDCAGCVGSCPVSCIEMV